MKIAELERLVEEARIDPRLLSEEEVFDTLEARYRDKAAETARKNHA